MSNQESGFPMSQRDWEMFDADMDTFFDLAFKKEKAGAITIGQIGDLFPDEFVLAQERLRNAKLERVQRLFPGLYRQLTADQLEELEIAIAYEEYDEALLEQETLRAEQIEDSWSDIQERLELRDVRRKAHIRKKRMLRN